MLRDIWSAAIAPFLGVRDLCALMSTSHGNLELWSADAAWRHQRNRVCAAWPALESLFDAAKTRKNKKSKSVGSIYRVFRNHLWKGCSPDDIMEISNTGLMESIFRNAIPYQEKFSAFSMNKGWQYSGEMNVELSLRTPTLENGGRIYISVETSTVTITTWTVTTYTHQTRHSVGGNWETTQTVPLCYCWKAFLFQQQQVEHAECWSEEAIRVIKAWSN